jgi:hypothetical protein
LPIHYSVEVVDPDRGISQYHVGAELLHNKVTMDTKTDF